MASESNIVKYYVNQAGNGAGYYYAGSSYQKGYSIGGFLGGLFRTILPFLRSGAAAVGREALRASSHILADATDTKQPIRESVRRHATEAKDNLIKQLAKKMTGSGIKRKRIGPLTQTKRNGGAAHIKKKRGNHRSTDYLSI